MRTVAEHQKAIRALVLPLADALGAEELAVSGRAIAAASSNHLGRILAEDIFAGIDLPPFDNSQMDGYAVRANELSEASDAQPVTLASAGTIAAGDPVGELAPGYAAPIMTGAPIPVGADAVIPIERATPARFQSPGPDNRVSFRKPVTVGTFVRQRGSDIGAGKLLLAAGARMGPAQWGTIASGGITTATVLRRLRVALISTGHELRHSGDDLQPGQIYDANSVALAGAIADAGASVQVAVVRDDPDELVAMLSTAHADLVVSTGGVSAGAFEVVRIALEPRGVEFCSVAMQPGGPQGFGLATLDEDRTVPVVAFPGNPVSALVSFEMFLRPVLRAVAGYAVPDRRAERRPLAAEVSSPHAKHQVRRGRIAGDGTVELVGGPGSHLLHSYAASSVLVHIPAGIGHLDAGSPVETWRIDD